MKTEGEAKRTGGSRKRPGSLDRDRALCETRLATPPSYPTRGLRPEALRPHLSEGLPVSKCYHLPFYRQPARKLECLVHSM